PEGLALDQVYLVLGDALRDQLDVGRDADGLDRFIAGGQILGDGKLQGRAVLERVDRLDAALAEGLAADDDRAVVVLEGAGHDLRGRGRAVVDDHDDGIVGLGVAGGGLVFFEDLIVGADGQDDGALGEKLIRDVDRLVEQAAGVIAQVDDQALEVFAAVAHRLEVAVHLASGLFLEALDPQDTDVAVRALRQLGLHGFDLDVGAGQGEVEGILDALPRHGDRDRGADLAT